jgi:hypothetical protein
MTKHQQLNLFYNCDECFFKGHKFKEQKLFQMDVSPQYYLRETTPPMDDKTSLKYTCEES